MAFHAVRLDPNNPNVRWHACLPLLFLGDTERTAAWLQLARDEGMEFHRLASAEANLQLMLGHPDRAAALARDMLERYPDTLEAGLMARSTLFAAGDWSAVSEALLALGEEAPNVWAMPDIMPRTQRLLRAFVLAEQGRETEARREFDQVLAASEAAFANGSTWQGRALDAASVHAYRGDHEAALRMLERAYELGLRADFVLAVDPMFATLREDPRFKALLERMADSRREQREIARRTGALEGYDALMAAGPAGQ
jgi:tetratricopeptide (TPR) repeat protein